MPKLRPCLFKILFFVSLMTLSGCAGSSAYDDTKGWGNDLWEEIKKGSKKAAISTKEALDSVTRKTQEAEEAEENVTSEEIKISATDMKKTEGGSTSTPSPLTESEKNTQPPVAKNNGSYAVHLSSNKSKKSAEHEWQELKNAFPKETKDLKLQLKSIKITGKGDFYRVLGASYKTRDSASKACEKFKLKKQYCSVVKL